MAEVNKFIVQDYLTVARERVTEQFKNKEVFDKYIQLLIWGATELQEQYRILMQERSLDTAEGRQLDIIGELVGLPRGGLPSEAYEGTFFGFSGDATALPFDDLSVPVDAGVFYSLTLAGVGFLPWDDPTYRMFLKAKIYANTSNGTYEEVVRAIKDILQVDKVNIIEIGGAKVHVEVNRLLNNVEEYILTNLGANLSLLPIPIGVGVDEIIESPPDFFGFAETPGALGFSSYDIQVGYGETYGEYYGGATGVFVGGGYFASLVG